MSRQVRETIGQPPGGTPRIQTVVAPDDRPADDPLPDREHGLRREAHPVAVGVTAGIAAGSYLIDILALSVNGLGWLQRLSPFFYYRDPESIFRGLDPIDAIVLGAIAVVSVAIAVWAFERRDLSA